MGIRRPSRHRRRVPIGSIVTGNAHNAEGTADDRTMTERLRTYPARLQAAVVAAVAAATSFGLDWTAEQTAAVTALSAALIALTLEGPRRP